MIITSDYERRVLEESGGKWDGSQQLMEEQGVFFVIGFFFTGANEPECVVRGRISRSTGVFQQEPATANGSLKNM